MVGTCGLAAGSSTPDGFKKALPSELGCGGDRTEEEAVRRSVPTPLVSRIVCLAVLEGSLIFLASLTGILWTADDDPDIEIGRIRAVEPLFVGLPFG